MNFQLSLRHMSYINEFNIGNCLGRKFSVYSYSALYLHLLGLCNTHFLRRDLPSLFAFKDVFQLA